LDFSFFIAKRYFFSRRKKNFIHIISLLSMIGVAFATAALVIVLSVFNGLGDLLHSLFGSFDPELKIEVTTGKSFELSPDIMDHVKNVRGVRIVTEVIEDYAYVRYRSADMVVTMKGVSDNFIDQHRLDGHLDDGKLKLKEKGIRFAIIGRGIRNTLSVSLDDDFDLLQVFYIRNLKSLDPAKLYAHDGIRPGGVFSIEKNYDENYIILPLDFVKDLMNYGDRRTSLEIKTDSSVNVLTVQSELMKLLGKNFRVLTNEEQHQDLYRLVKFEKLFTFMALSLLISIGSINIFFSLMMLVIDKRKDITIIAALGAGQSTIRRIFILEGAIISFLGAGSGLIIGGLLCWAQDRFGLVGMGIENAVITSYPVVLRWSDFASISLVILVISFLISRYPAARASKLYSPNLL
jgi:lipoprotein-releasing system permease protein